MIEDDFDGADRSKMMRSRLRFSVMGDGDAQVTSDTVARPDAGYGTYCYLFPKNEMREIGSQKAVAPPSSTCALLEMRGGAGPIDPTLLIDVMTVAGLGQGFLSLEAPEPSLDLYCAKDKSLYSQACMRLTGAGVLSVGVLALCLFRFGTSVPQAIGWTLLIWIMEHARNLLNRLDKKSEQVQLGAWDGSCYRQWQCMPALRMPPIPAHSCLVLLACWR